MRILELFLRRPVLAIVLNLILLLVGIRSFSALPLRQFPNMDTSVINIFTSYAGASAKLMEGFISTPLENAVSNSNGIDFITSSSDEGSSSINIHFKLGFNIDPAVSDIISKISSARYLLPKDINDPIVSKQDPNANPTMYMAFSSNTLSPEAITDYLIRVVQPQLQTITGMSEAKILGGREYAMRVWLNPWQMAARNITASDVQQALLRNNQQSAASRLTTQWQEYAINAKTDISSAEQFNQLVIKMTPDYLVRLADIGHAQLGPADDRTTIDAGGKPGIFMGLVPQTTANPLDLAKAVYQILPELKAQLPAALQMSINWDSSKFIRASLHEVAQTVLEAIIFVIAIIFLFLGSWRSVLIPIVTIPLSLLGVCSLMLMLGYSINTLTLLAWVLAIGLVVDDSIVVLENIHRHIEEGLPSMEAALVGIKEISWAIIAMTLTLAAVYMPIGFLTGLTGSLFREFAFTLASAVIISGWVALTLSPLMCASWLKQQHTTNRFAAKLERGFQGLLERYQSLLSKLVLRPKIILSIAGVVYLSCYFLYSTLPDELAPTEDQGAIMTFATAPTSANLAYTEKYTKQIAQAYQRLPETVTYGIVNGFNGVNSALSFLVLKPWNERKRSADEIIQALFPQFWGITGVMAFPVNLPALPGTNERTPISLILKTTGSYENLYSATQKILAKMQQEPRLLNVDSDFKWDKQQINLSIDRDKAAALGIPMSEISTALNLLLGQPTVTRFTRFGRSYDVIPQLLPAYSNQPQQLDNIYLHTNSDTTIPLANIAKFELQAAPESLYHFQQQRAAKINASLAPGYTIGQALHDIEKMAKQVLPEDIQYDYAGQSRQFVQATGAMQQTFAFALLFIFLVLAAQFESFIDPLIVMLSVPLSLFGALFAMHLTGATLNIYTQIGLVTLVGLISKHGIMIVEFANQLRRQGQALHQAVVHAAALRLRPILMTTGAMLLGALPLAIAKGAGAASRSQLGIVIIGGMSFGTLLTLFIIPTVYLLVENLKAAKTGH